MAVGRIKQFLKEVRQEMKKVTWPNRQETVRYTLWVIGISAFVAILLGTFDIIFQKLLKILIS